MYRRGLKRQDGEAVLLHLRTRKHDPFVTRQTAFSIKDKSPAERSNLRTQLEGFWASEYFDVSMGYYVLKVLGFSESEVKEKCRRVQIKNIPGLARELLTDLFADDEEPAPGDTRPDHVIPNDEGVFWDPAIEGGTEWRLNPDTGDFVAV